MLLTILTPTFNRAFCLSAAWQSLVNQTEYCFEWLIIDDGSEDDTETLVSSWIDQSPFKIVYIKQKNGGKHRALNRGICFSDLRYISILDSDDVMLPDFAKLVNKYVSKYEHYKDFGGISGRINDKYGKLIGPERLALEYCSTIEYRYTKGVLGDQFEVFKTDILKRFLFPEIEKEKFVPEALIWNRIGQKYNLMHVPDIFQVRDYLSGGLTDRIVKIRMTSPIASMMTYGEMTFYDIPLTQKLKAYLNFWRFSFNSTKNMAYKLSLISSNFGIIVYPIGYLLYLKDVVG